MLAEDIYPSQSSGLRFPFERGIPLVNRASEPPCLTFASSASQQFTLPACPLAAPPRPLLHAAPPQLHLCTAILSFHVSTCPRVPSWLPAALLSTGQLVNGPASCSRAQLCTFAQELRSDLHLCTAFLSSGPPVLVPSYLLSGSGSAAFTPAGNSPRSSNAVMVALKVTVPALPRSAVMERLPIARYGARDFTLS